jgi:Flp pilus assembly protein TadB
VIGAALALIVVGIVLTFFIPWVGPVVGAVGLALLIAYLVGFGRRAASDREPKPEGPNPEP